MPHRHAWKLALLVFLASLPLKLFLARDLPWEIDYVPLIWRNWQFLQGGPFPAVGTLSSVAAYNMPFLVWLHLPALAITHHAALTMLITMLAWNTLTCAYIYALGRVLFRPVVGLLAVTIFAFSPTGISSAYTSWAQLLLPGFYAMTLYHLWQWHRTDKAIHMILCGVIALCAFMTHFSAVVLFPVIFVEAILLRVRWSISGVVIGVVIGGLLLAPYIAFEMERDFADVRAFTSREKQVPREILAQYEPYKIENSGQTAVVSSGSPSGPQPQVIVTEEAASPSLVDRVAYRLNEAWNQIKIVLTFPSNGSQQFFAVPTLNFMPAVMTLSLWSSVLWALYRLSRVSRRSGWRSAWTVWRESDAGRALFIAGSGLCAAGIMIGLRSGQDTYYMGLLSLIAVLIAYVWLEVWLYKFIVGRLVIVALIVVWIVANVADRLTVDHSRDDAVFSSYNVSLYRHVETTAALIAQDYGPSGPITISYDVLPELPNLWWLPAWGSIDPLYRMGAPYDVLLEMNYGLVNTNTAPLGPVEQPDYVVVYTPGLIRYNASTYEEVGRAGTTVVLKPR